MGWATSEQALELLVADTPERYRSEAFHCVRGAVLGSALTIASAGMGLYCATKSLAKLADNTIPVLEPLFFAYFAHSMPKLAGLTVQQVIDAQEYFAQAHATGQCEKAYMTENGIPKRQLLTREQTQATEFSAYPDLGAIPLGATGLVNAVPVGEPVIRNRPDSQYIEYSAQTTQGTTFLSIEIGDDADTLLAELPRSHILVIAQRTPEKYQVNLVGAAIPIDWYYQGRRRSITQKRTDLAWQPLPAHT